MQRKVEFGGYMWSMTQENMTKYQTPYSKFSVFKKGHKLIKNSLLLNRIMENFIIFLFFVYFLALMLPSAIITEAEKIEEKMKNPPMIVEKQVENTCYMCEPIKK